MRTIIIGDIHGHITPLKKILKALSPDPASDRLIFLGDLFDRGPASWEVFQCVKELDSAFGGRFVLLEGNHEGYLLQQRLSFAQRMVWERVGRSTTVLSFKQHGELMEDSIPWLKEHVVTHYKEERFQCVHAGIKVDPIEANDAYTMIRDHNVVLKNRYAGPLTITGHIALQKPAWFCGDGETVMELEAEKKQQEEASAGEDVAVWKDLPQYGVLCIDTSCGKGGPLTAMVVEDGKYRLYSADEKREDKVNG